MTMLCYATSVQYCTLLFCSIVHQNVSAGAPRPSSQQGVGGGGGGLSGGQAPGRRTLENTYRTAPAERFRESDACRAMQAVLERYLPADDARPALELVLGAGWETAGAAESRGQPTRAAAEKQHATTTGSAISRPMQMPADPPPPHSARTSEGLRTRERSGAAAGGGGDGAQEDKRDEFERQTSKSPAKGSQEDADAQEPASARTSGSAARNSSTSARVRRTPSGRENDAARDKSPSNSRTPTPTQQREASARRASSGGPSPNAAGDSSRNASAHPSGSASRGASPRLDAGAARETSAARAPHESSAKSRHLEAASPQRQQQPSRPSATQSKRSSLDASAGRQGAVRLSVPAVPRPVSSPVVLDWSHLMPRLCVRLADVIRREVALVTPPRYCTRLSRAFGKQFIKIKYSAL